MACFEKSRLITSIILLTNQWNTPNKPIHYRSQDIFDWLDRYHKKVTADLPSTFLDELFLRGRIQTAHSSSYLHEKVYQMIKAYVKNDWIGNWSLRSTPQDPFYQSFIGPAHFVAHKGKWIITFWARFFSRIPGIHVWDL